MTFDESVVIHCVVGWCNPASETFLPGLRHGLSEVVSQGRFVPVIPVPHGGVRRFLQKSQKSTCLTQLTLTPSVMQSWTLDTPKSGPNQICVLHRVDKRFLLIGVAAQIGSGGADRDADRDGVSERPKRLTGNRDHSPDSHSIGGKYGPHSIGGKKAGTTGHRNQPLNPKCRSGRGS